MIHINTHEELTELCQSKNYKGAQDESLKLYGESRLLYDYILDTKIIHLKGPQKYVIDLDMNIGIANVSIKGDWEYMSALFHGQRYDRIYKKSGENTFDMFNNGACMPYLHSMDTVIEIEGNDYVLTYDIVSVKYDDNNTYFIKNIQTCGDDLLKIGENLLKGLICYNHPVEKITFFTDNPVEDLLVIIDETYLLNCTQMNDLKWELNFGGNTLNFSKINNIILKCKNSFQDNRIINFAVTHHLIRVASGMTGMAFSK